MPITIRPIRKNDAQDVDRLVELSLAAWAPFFETIHQVIGRELALMLNPDWRASQSAAIRGICAEDSALRVWVAEWEGQMAGFVAYQLNYESKAGEVQFLAVDPEFQKRGIGAALNDFALEKLKEAGMTLAVVETGGDPSHAPARRSYERAGYTLLPIARYFKAL